MSIQRSSSLPDVKRRFHVQTQAKYCSIGFHVFANYKINPNSSSKNISNKVGKKIFFKKYIFEKKYFCAFCSDGQEEQLLKIFAKSDG